MKNGSETSVFWYLQDSGSASVVYGAIFELIVFEENIHGK